MQLFRRIRPLLVPVHNLLLLQKRLHKMRLDFNSFGSSGSKRTNNGVCLSSVVIGFKLPRIPSPLVVHRNCRVRRQAPWEK